VNTHRRGEPEELAKKLVRGDEEGARRTWVSLSEEEREGLRYRQGGWIRTHIAMLDEEL
jgi:hypothetical protein